MTSRSQEASRSRRADGESTYQDLVDAALAIWSEQGMGHVTMNAVAKRAGRTRGTAYHHFADHAALIAAVHEKLRSRLDSLFDFAKAEPREGYGTVPRIIVGNPEIVRSYFTQLLRGAPDEDPLVNAALKHFRDVKHLGWLHDQIDPEHAAFISIAMWLAALLVIDRHTSQEARLDAANRFTETNQIITERAINKPVDQRKAPRQNRP